MDSKPTLSVVTPVYCAEEIVGMLVERIIEKAQCVTDDFEVILVDDGSLDGSWERIIGACSCDARIKGVRLTRNFGQQNAITAGLAYARGNYVIVMDCDLQDDPQYIPELVNKAREGYDVVLTRRQTRAYGWSRNLVTGIFYRILKLTGDLPVVDSNLHGYSLVSRRVVEAFMRLEDYQRDYLMLVQWMGFRQSILPVEHATRFAGTSSYTWAKLIRHATAAISCHSKSLLKLAIAFGFAYMTAATAFAVYLVVSYFVHGYRAGWASTMVIILASTGVILLAIGVEGIYLGNIFDQVRRRPLFLVQQTLNQSPLSQDQESPSRGN